MAKHRDEHDEPKKNTPRPEPIEAAEVLEEAEAADAVDSPKKTQLAKKSAQPTQLSHKAAPPTQLAGDVPDMSLGKPDSGARKATDDELVPAETAAKGSGSDVLADEPLEAMPLSGASSAVEAVAMESDVREAEPISETKPTSEAKPAPKSDSSDDLFSTPMEEHEPTHSSSSIFGREYSQVSDTPSGKGSMIHKEEALEEILEAEEASGAKRKQELAETIAFDSAGDDPSGILDSGILGADSAIEVGKKPAKKSGVDLGAASDSSVDLGASPGDSGSSVELGSSAEISSLDELVAEEGSGAKKLLSEEQTQLDPDAFAGDGKKAKKPTGVTLDKTEIPGKMDKKKALVEVDEDEEAGPKKSKKPAPAKGKGSGLLMGAGVGVLVTAATVAGIWFVQPDILTSFTKASPNYVEAPRQKDKPPPPVVTAAQQARDLMIKGDYAGAYNLVKSDTKDPDALALRGEARWLKYAKEQQAKKAPLDRNSEDVTEALKDLGEAKATLLVQQIEAAVDYPKLVETVKGSEKALLELDDLRTKADMAEKMLALVNEALKSANVKDAAGAKGVEVVVAARKDLEDKLDAVNKALDEAKVKTRGAKGVEEVLVARKELKEKLDAVDKVLADANVKEPGAKGLQALLDVRDKLAKDRDELDGAMRAAYKELEGAKLVPAGGDPRTKILEGIKLARTKAESPLTIPLTQLASSMSGLGTGMGYSLEKAFDRAALLAELNFYRMREPLIESPEKKLDTHITLLLNRDNNNPKVLAAAARDAAWLIAPEANSKAEMRGKALLVAGLALRNQRKFEEARKNLSDAVAAGGDAAWVSQAKAALKELSDPSSALGAIERHAESGNLDKAAADLSWALEAMPENGRLRAWQSLLRLEAARRAGKLAEAEAEIRKSAEAAAKDKEAVAEAAYTLGQLEEELGHIGKAEGLYRLAIKAHQGSADAGARYRIALARILQRDAMDAPAPPKGKEEPKDKEEPKKDEEQPKQDEKQSRATLQALIAVALVGVQGLPGEDEGDPAVMARLKESIELAKELIQSDNPKIKGQGHLILGQALSKMGQRTDGMKEYARGLEILYPGMQSKEMTRLIDEHPAFQQPDAIGRPNLFLAERFFGKGQHLYWEKKYALAEEQFLQAVKYFPQDARYQYYLGLSQWGQKDDKNGKGKRDSAINAFEQGARLEVANRPSTGEVNNSIERLQGGLRQMLNTYRQKALETSN